LDGDGGDEDGWDDYYYGDGRKDVGLDPYELGGAFTMILFLMSIIRRIFRLLGEPVNFVTYIHMFLDHSFSGFHYS